MDARLEQYIRNGHPTDKIEIIITEKKTEEYLVKKNIKNRLFKINKISNYISQLFEISAINDFLNKIKINHPFYNFIKKNNYDLIIFLGPSQMSKFCKEVGFISNIWDLDPGVLVFVFFLYPSV